MNSQQDKISEITATHSSSNKQLDAMKNDFTEMQNKHLNISQKIEHLEKQNEDNYSTMVDFKNDFNKNVEA